MFLWMYVCISVSMCPGFLVEALVCRVQDSAVHVDVTKISPKILSAFKLGGLHVPNHNLETKA